MIRPTGLYLEENKSRNMNIEHSPYVLAYRRRYKNNSPEYSKYETIKDSMKTVGKEYCSESSICGLKHLVNENTTHIERIIWVIILISALICSASLVWLTFSKYYKAPLVTTQMPEGVSVSTIIFPAVGICSNNRVSKRAVTELADNLLKEERNKKYNKTEMMSLLFGLGQLYNLQGLSGDNMRAKQLHIALGDYDVTELMRNLTPHCDDLLLRCAWNDKAEDCNHLFNVRLTMNGFCCTFNYLRQSDIFEDRNSGQRSMDMYKYGNKSSFDFDMGLKVLLKIDDSDDFYYNIPSLGSTLQFSDAYDFPDAPSGSFSMKIISPNVQMVVMVTASFTEASRDIQHVSVKLRSCLFYDESSYLPFYTHSDCMLKCRMLFLLQNCNCTPFNMPKINNGRTCDMQDIPCLGIYYAQSIAVRPEVDEIPAELELDKVGGGIRCPMCYPSCSKTMYYYDFNNVVIYPSNLNSVPDEDRENWLVGANYTGASIVHVKYAKEVADCYGQNVIMKWFDLISNIGSTCGFVTGFSFVSVLEFFYFFTVKLFREVHARRQRGTQQNLTAIQPRTPQFKPITRYRPIYWNELGNNVQKNQQEHQ
ncbi:sodium channel protein Nach-like [Cydia amplana]|uniref:sodium channel protein Nach-like n=1 Tax=Cydia amplana TaxID=1869771 RepID=UPI002FE5A90C